MIHGGTPMLTRVAIYEGTIETGKEEEFFGQVKSKLEPMWRRFPNVTGVRVLRVTQSDPGALQVPMILEMDFPSMEAIQECLHSDILPQAHQATLDVLKLFKGRFYHLITESRSLPPDPKA
jgi:hypothetical protein